MPAERELARRITEQSAVARLGELALQSSDLAALMRTVADVVAETLEVAFGGVIELDAPRNVMVVRAAHGWPERMIGLECPIDETTQTGHTLLTGEPVVVEDFRDQTQYVETDWRAANGTRSGLTVAMRGKRGLLGALAAHDTEPHQFSSDRVAFLQSVANLLAAAIERSEVEEQLRRQALTDSLTGLPNRMLLLDRLEHALAAREHDAVGVLFVDLDDFKVINDTLGHQIGDQLLCDIAPRILSALRPEDTVARFGGDEFVILCEGLAGMDDALGVAGRVRETFATPFVIAGQLRQLTVSIGVVISREGGDPTTLIRDADAAVYRAKEKGRGWIEPHDDAARQLLVRRVQVEQDVRTALNLKSFEPFFQPIVDLRGDAETVGWEALARWHHPTRGIVNPIDFIAIAEETGLIVPLSEHVMLCAADAARGWEHGQVAVNISPRLLGGGGLPGLVERVLARTGLAAHRLTLELTETTLFDTTPRALHQLLEVEELGVRIVLDDFGTGFSSLSHLRRVRVDAVKIDRSFIAHMTRPGNEQVIVRAVLSMAAELDIDVVAEGVETLEQAEMLRELGCPLAQGFLFGTPAPVAEPGVCPWESRTP